MRSFGRSLEPTAKLDPVHARHPCVDENGVGAKDPDLQKLVDGSVCGFQRQAGPEVSSCKAMPKHSNHSREARLLKPAKQDELLERAMSGKARQNVLLFLGSDVSATMHVVNWRVRAIVFSCLVWVACSGGTGGGPSSDGGAGTGGASATSGGTSGSAGTSRGGGLGGVSGASGRFNASSGAGRDSGPGPSDGSLIDVLPDVAVDAGAGFVPCDFNLFGEPGDFCNLAAGEACCQKIDQRSLKPTGGECLVDASLAECRIRTECDDDVDCTPPATCERFFVAGIGESRACSS